MLKISIFDRVYEGDGLFKPNSASWRSEDELWDCWVAFAGSEPETGRICIPSSRCSFLLKKKLKRNWRPPPKGGKRPYRLFPLGLYRIYRVQWPWSWGSPSWPGWG